MRIDELTLQNFRGIPAGVFKFPRGHRRVAGGNNSFNLLVGPNGAGKTSILEGLAVAASGVFLTIRGTDVRHIRREDAHVVMRIVEGRAMREPQYPVRVEASGILDGTSLTWARSLASPLRRTSHREAGEMMTISRNLGIRALDGWEDPLPLISYYGADRLWSEPRDMERKRKADLKPKGPHQMKRVTKNEAEAAWEQFSVRTGGYSNSVNGRCSPRDLQRWLGFEDYKAYREGKESIHSKIVRQAMVDCLPGVTEARYDPGLATLIYRNEGKWTEFSHLSEGQRDMAALVGDIAWKAAQLNPQLGGEAMRGTPGLVLIDELDMHLHPEWQRLIVRKLQELFPCLQFICATHSPEIISEVPAEEIIPLDRGASAVPDIYQTEGMDSNWILRRVMGTRDRPEEVETGLTEIDSLIEKDKYAAALKKISAMEARYGGFEELDARRAMIDQIELLAK